MDLEHWVSHCDLRKSQGCRGEPDTVAHRLITTLVLAMLQIHRGNSRRHVGLAAAAYRTALSWLSRLRCTFMRRGQHEAGSGHVYRIGVAQAVQRAHETQGSTRLAGMVPTVERHPMRMSLLT